MWAGPFEPQSIFGHLGGATGSQQKSFLHFHMVISCNCATLVCNHINKVKFASKLFHFYQNFYEIIIFGHNDLIFKRTTFQCGNQNNRTPRNLSSADFPRVRIKNFSGVKKCSVQKVMMVVWNVKKWVECVIKVVVVASCDSFFNICIVGSVAAILRTIYNTRKNENEQQRRKMRKEWMS